MQADPGVPQHDPLVAVRAMWYADMFRAAWQLRLAIRRHTYNVPPEGVEMCQFAQAADLALLGAPPEIGAVVRELVAIADEWTVAATVRGSSSPGPSDQTKPEIEKVFLNRIAVMRAMVHADLGLPGSADALSWPPTGA